MSIIVDQAATEEEINQAIAGLIEADSTILDQHLQKAGQSYFVRHRFRLTDPVHTEYASYLVNMEPGLTDPNTNIDQAIILNQPEEYKQRPLELIKDYLFIEHKLVGRAESGGPRRESTGDYYNYVPSADNPFSSFVREIHVHRTPAGETGFQVDLYLQPVPGVLDSGAVVSANLNRGPLSVKVRIDKPEEGLSDLAGQNARLALVTAYALSAFKQPTQVTKEYYEHMGSGLSQHDPHLQRTGHYKDKAGKTQYKKFRPDAADNYLDFLKDIHGEDAVNAALAAHTPGKTVIPTDIQLAQITTVQDLKPIITRHILTLEDINEIWHQAGHQTNITFHQEGTLQEPKITYRRLPSIDDLKKLTREL